MRCLCRKSRNEYAAALTIIVAATIVSTSCRSAHEKTIASSEDVHADDPASVLNYTMPRLDGAAENLAQYKGKVVLIVNTASKCGLTPQYKELEALYEAKKDDGLIILGFPANNFRNQEPGTDKEIAEYCAQNYGVTFPMFSKVSVKGEDMCPLYTQLTGMPAPLGGEIQWNFDKFLVDRTGRVVARFSPKTTPDDPELVAKVNELLKTDG